jgi:hypothetical protein
MLTFLFWLLCPSRNIPFFPGEQELAAFKVSRAKKLRKEKKGRGHGRGNKN